jgi:hypothetical protein
VAAPLLEGKALGTVLYCSRAEAKKQDLCINITTPLLEGKALGTLLQQSQKKDFSINLGGLHQYCREKRWVLLQRPENRTRNGAASLPVGRELETAVPHQRPENRVSQGKEV